jgi:hypothetical protein
MCKLLRIANMLHMVVDMANLAIKNKCLARMSEEDVIIKQNITIFHIYSYLYNINLLHKNTRIKAADEWTTLTTNCDLKDKGLEDCRQAYVQNLKKLAEKLSRKWKQQIRQMHIKAFHKKIVLMSKQLPCTAPSLAPPLAKRPHIEVIQEQTELLCNGDMITKPLDISLVMPIWPMIATATFLPLVPALATVAAPSQDSTNRKKQKRTQDPTKK